MEINIMKQIYTFMIMNKKFIALGYLQIRNIPNLCQFYSSNVLRHIRKRPTSICYRKQFLAILPMWDTCHNKRNGMDIIGYYKDTLKEETKSQLNMLSEQYHRYKKPYRFPTRFRG